MWKDDERKKKWKMFTERKLEIQMKMFTCDISKRYDAWMVETQDKSESILHIYVDKVDTKKYVIPLVNADYAIF